MSEVEKHRLVFDRPHIYKCKCGMVHMIFISEFKVEEKTLEMPKNVEYMPCGHATCARREDGACIICLNRSLTQRAADGARFCPACHSLLEENSVYCDNCGTDTPRR